MSPVVILANNEDDDDEANAELGSPKTGYAGASEELSSTVDFGLNIAAAIMLSGAATLLLRKKCA